MASREKYLLHFAGSDTVLALWYDNTGSASVGGLNRYGNIAAEVFTTAFQIEEPPAWIKTSQQNKYRSTIPCTRSRFKSAIQELRKQMVVVEGPLSTLGRVAI